MPTPEEIAALGGRLNPETWAEVVKVMRRARNSSLRKRKLATAWHLHKTARKAVKNHAIAYELATERLRCTLLGWDADMGVWEPEGRDAS